MLHRVKWLCELSTAQSLDRQCAYRDSTKSSDLEKSSRLDCRELLAIVARRSESDPSRRNPRDQSRCDREARELAEVTKDTRPTCPIPIRPRFRGFRQV